MLFAQTSYNKHSKISYELLVSTESILTCSELTMETLE